MPTTPGENRDEKRAKTMVMTLSGPYSSKGTDFITAIERIKLQLEGGATSGKTTIASSTGMTLDLEWSIKDGRSPAVRSLFEDVFGPSPFLR